MTSDTRKDCRKWRHERLRQKVRGTASCPRMSVMVSNKHMYVQFIDDEKATTLVSASTLKSKERPTVAYAKELGKRAAHAAIAKGITTVVFDRGGFKYHGRVKAIADTARETGLKF